MTKPKSNPGDPNRKVVRIIGYPGDDPAELHARSITRPMVQAAATIQEFEDKNAETELTVNALIEELQRHCDAANNGNLTREEEMLVAQAHTLDAIFNTLARRASGQGYLRNWETFMRLPLKAQSQCRTTIETLAAIKNPQPVAFVRQANIAAGPQQVNNGSNISCAGEKENAPNQLLETNDGERLDARAASTASGSNPTMETVRKVDGANVSGG